MKNTEQKLTAIKNLVQDWIDKQGHEKCWYYPSILEEIARILEIKFTKNPCLPSRKEFEEGCRKYQNEIYNTT